MKRIDVPTLMAHRGDARGAPIQASAPLSREAGEGRDLEGQSWRIHGLAQTDSATSNRDLLAFIRA